ncbi:hypothetical protein HGM15179_006502 [Zosterops borbonicus]|uniref:Uncharacterized protein n=1 Tax=Zosterops borbonicus TaxID=364589 RepID=A0A8K1GNG4_9PASS|nr:hypothetical protein HGM15179_006502 [Zosterops borbonicus]
MVSDLLFHLGHHKSLGPGKKVFLTVTKDTGVDKVLLYALWWDGSKDLESQGKLLTVVGEPNQDVPDPEIRWEGLSPELFMEFDISDLMDWTDSSSPLEIQIRWSLEHPGLVKGVLPMTGELELDDL